jgi:hypothetical protein
LPLPGVGIPAIGDGSDVRFATYDSYTRWSCDATRKFVDLHISRFGHAFFGPCLSNSDFARLVPSIMSISNSLDPIVANALASLDLLTPKDIPNLDDSCPICLLTFRAVLDSRDDNVVPGKADAGVARVGGCGHMFCVEE